MHPLGREAEANACDFLKTQGLRLLEQNFRSISGEIDLIMEDGKDVVFVEVRHRSQKKFGTALESVNKNKQQKLIKTALYF